MKSMTYLMTVVALTAIFAFRSSDEAVSAVAGPKPLLLPSAIGEQVNINYPYFKLIRADFRDGDNFNGDADTRYFLFNGSLSSSLTVGPVYVLGGMNGNTLINTYNGLVGTTIPPLGTVTIALSQIPGLPTSGSMANPIIDSVAFSFAGNYSLDLSGEISLRSNSGSIWCRSPLRPLEILP